MTRTSQRHIQPAFLPGTIDNHDDMKPAPTFPFRNAERMDSNRSPIGFDRSSRFTGRQIIGFALHRPLRSNPHAHIDDCVQQVAFRGGLSRLPLKAVEQLFSPLVGVSHHHRTVEHDDPRFGLLMRRDRLNVGRRHGRLLPLWERLFTTWPFRHTLAIPPVPHELVVEAVTFFTEGLCELNVGNSQSIGPEIPHDIEPPPLPILSRLFISHATAKRTLADDHLSH
jgi:hypothetical protein